MCSSKGILRKGTVTFSTPAKSAVADGTKRSVSEHKTTGARSVAPLIEKGLVLSSALAAAHHSEQSQHTPSQLQKFSFFASGKPPHGSQTAPRPFSTGAREMDGESDDDFDFSQDVTSLSEILQGSGISEKRLAPEAATMRKSSVHEFRQLREKRSSIFKGAIRVVKTNLKGMAASSRNQSFYSTAAAPSIRESSIFSRTAVAAASGTAAAVAPRAASAKSQNEDQDTPSKNSTLFYMPTNTPERLHMVHAAAGAAHLYAAAAWGGSATPSRSKGAVAARSDMTPRSVHKGTSGFGAKVGVVSFECVCMCCWHKGVWLCQCARTYIKHVYIYTCKHTNTCTYKYMYKYKHTLRIHVIHTLTYIHPYIHT